MRGFTVVWNIQIEDFNLLTYIIPTSPTHDFLNTYVFLRKGGRFCPLYYLRHYTELLCFSYTANVHSSITDKLHCKCFACKEHIFYLRAKFTLNCLWFLQIYFCSSFKIFRNNIKNVLKMLLMSVDSQITDFLCSSSVNICSVAKEEKENTKTKTSEFLPLK